MTKTGDRGSICIIRSPVNVLLKRSKECFDVMLGANAAPKTDVFKANAAKSGPSATPIATPNLSTMR